MSFFTDCSEIDKYIGGVFRDAGDHPQSGPKFRAANIVLRVFYTDPAYELTVALREDFQVICGPSDLKPDITMTMPADVADRFWRGDYNLTVGLATGQIKAHGRHFCLGASLARLEVMAVLNAVLDRYQSIGLTDDPGTKQTASLLTHAYVRLPLHLS